MHWKVKLQRSSRQFHYWGAIVASIPVLIIIASGLLLQVKKEFTWIQPPTQKGAEAVLSLQFEEILQIAKQDPNALIKGWDDIARLDVRPSKGLVKVRSVNDWEVQIDTSNGSILQSLYRRSDWIESIHDGSFFNNNFRLWVFLPAGLILLILWISGCVIFSLMLWSRWQVRSKRALRLRSSFS